MSELTREQIERWRLAASDPNEFVGGGPETNRQLLALCDLALRSLAPSQSGLTDIFTVRETETEGGRDIWVVEFCDLQVNGYPSKQRASEIAEALNVRLAALRSRASAPVQAVTDDPARCRFCGKQLDEFAPALRATPQSSGLADELEYWIAHQDRIGTPLRRMDRDLMARAAAALRAAQVQPSEPVINVSWQQAVAEMRGLPFFHDGLQGDLLEVPDKAQAYQLGYLEALRELELRLEPPAHPPSPATGQDDSELDILKRALAVRDADLDEATRELEKLRPAPETAGWISVSGNDPTRGVAWVDSDATHVGKIVDGQRYLLTLPAAPGKGE